MSSFTLSEELCTLLFFF